MKSPISVKFSFLEAAKHASGLQVRTCARLLVHQEKKKIKSLPDIISFTICLSFADEASAALVQVLAALCALEAGCMPLQVRGHPHDVLVLYRAPAAHAHCNS